VVDHYDSGIVGCGNMCHDKGGEPICRLHARVDCAIGPSDQLCLLHFERALGLGKGSHTGKRSVKSVLLKKPVYQTHGTLLNWNKDLLFGDCTLHFLFVLPTRLALQRPSSFLGVINPIFLSLSRDETETWRRFSSQEKSTIMTRANNKRP